MANQSSNEGSSSSTNVSEQQDSTLLHLNIKTLDSRIYTFQVDKNVSFIQSQINLLLLLFVCLFVFVMRLLIDYSFQFSIISFQMPVSLFKDKIATEVGLPVNQQRLIFRGKVLKDEHLLSHYRILLLFLHQLLNHSCSRISCIIKCLITVILIH
jgi:hypothetical protein